jgi:4'-phosphopantetheinyl transferase
MNRKREWVFVEQSNAPPRISNLPEGCWLSLSHSHGAICFALSQQPVGIDIERGDTRKNFSALAKAFMTTDELDMLNLNPQYSNPPRLADMFYRIWCAKEAYYKITPIADQAKLFLKKIAYLDLAEGNNGHHLIAGNIDEYHLALVTTSKPANFRQIVALSFDSPIPILWS